MAIANIFGRDRFGQSMTDAEIAEYYGLSVPLSRLKPLTRKALRKFAVIDYGFIIGGRLLAIYQKARRIAQIAVRRDTGEPCNLHCLPSQERSKKENG